MTPDQYAAAAKSFEEIEVAGAGKRCGVQHTPWMGDWFTSWSPRNDNSNAEGPWDHWVDLALMILQDPMTGLVRPEARAAVREVPTQGFYDQTTRALTDAELLARFAATPDEVTQ